MADFLNKHPALLGVIIVLITSVELWFVIFRYERLQKFLKRHWLLRIIQGQAQSKSAEIAGLTLFLVIGLILLDSAIHLLPKMFWAAALLVAFSSFVGLSVRDKWKEHKNNRLKSD